MFDQVASLSASSIRTATLNSMQSAAERAETLRALSAGELDLLYMGRGAPHVGFPEAVLGKYAEKLVSLGYKVGVVEQMET